jgi:cytochrome c oxidase subunit III
MASGLSETDLDEPRIAHGGPGGRGPGGDGPDFRGGGGDSGGGDFNLSPNIYQIGMIVALFSITALFVALVLAYGVQLSRQAPSAHRVHIPIMLWISTGLLFISSVSFEVGRSGLRRGQQKQYLRSLQAAIVLGLAFIGSQLAAWFDLKRQGVFMGANLRGSMFYVFTGMHGLHVLLGILSLSYLVFNARRLSGGTEQMFRLERARASAVGLYWHFMGMLWMALFVLLYIWS